MICSSFAVRKELLNKLAWKHSHLELKIKSNKMSPYSPSSVTQLSENHKIQT